MGFSKDNLSDPLFIIDDDPDEFVRFSLLKAEYKRMKMREEILANCVNLRGAAQLISKSQNYVKRLDQRGELLSLHTEDGKLFPLIQFDSNFTKGIVPGLKEIQEHLQLSFFGVYMWLTAELEMLYNDTPIDYLKKNKVKEVLELAEEHGYML